jgi:hypothetical protein
VPFVGEPFLARVPPHDGRSAAPLAAGTAHRASQGAAAQYRIVVVGCGFADQSHLTRVFTRMVGVSPGAWRRALDGQQAEGAQDSRSQAA